jgi:hypothetical protein
MGFLMFAERNACVSPALAPRTTSLCVGGIGSGAPGADVEAGLVGGAGAFMDGDAAADRVATAKLSEPLFEDPLAAGMEPVEFAEPLGAISAGQPTDRRHGRNIWLF